MFRWRRVVAVCAASILLHYAALDWGGAPLSAPAAPAPPPIVAELLAPVAEAESAPPSGMADAGAANPMPQVQLATPPAAAKAARAARPGYKVSLPPPAQLVFDVLRVEADGNERRGSAVMNWRHGRGQYQLTVRIEAGASAPLELASEGTVGAAGIVPRELRAQHGSKARTATHFNAQQGRISFSASEASVPMAPGTQDKASLPLQLAGIARADRRQLRADIEILVGEEKDAVAMRFVVAGKEEIETPMGRLATWHLSFQPAPGSYRTGLEVWLAAEHEWYPVQLRSTEASGAVTTRTIRAIVPTVAGN